MTNTQNPKSSPKAAAPPANLGARIARLPKLTRDLINLLLDDGLPYHVILNELAETADAANPQELAKWVKSGYENHLKNRENIEGAKTEAEFAADLLGEFGEIDPMVIHRACLVVASIQIFEAIFEHGDTALRDMLLRNPANYLTLLNALRTLRDSNRKAS